MINITINPHPNKTSDSGLDIQRLKESSYFRDREEYSDLVKNNAGSLTQAYGNDASSIFMVAYQDLVPNAIQMEILSSFLLALISIENMIDPERLKFTITKAMDNEICINRPATTGGRVKLIINDDGVIALSYLPNKTSQRKSELEFYDKNTEFESLAYSFFKL